MPLRNASTRVRAYQTDSGASAVLSPIRRTRGNGGMAACAVAERGKTTDGDASGAGRHAITQAGAPLPLRDARHHALFAASFAVARCARRRNGGIRRDGMAGGISGESRTAYLEQTYALGHQHLSERRGLGSRQQVARCWQHQRMRILSGGASLCLTFAHAVRVNRHVNAATRAFATATCARPATSLKRTRIVRHRHAYIADATRSGALQATSTRCTRGNILRRRHALRQASTSRVAAATRRTRISIVTRGGRHSGWRSTAA